MSTNFIFVSDSVTEGHPDKLCDQISDALVDEYLRNDPRARIDAECAVANGIVFIGAHYHAEHTIEVADTARSVIDACGYRDGDFNGRDCTILTSLNEVEAVPRLPEPEGEPEDDWLDKFVAQHQATLFGYACNQTPELMPLPIRLAHRLAQELDAARRDQRLTYLLPDAKTQVAVEYDDRRPRRIHTVSVTTSADPSRVSDHKRLVDDLVEAVIVPAMSDTKPGIDKKTRILVNNDGVIRAGGPAVHSGLTGRKTAVDTYGEYARHSGAALSGKDPLRIDRVGAYAARHIAKNIVGAGLADECEVQISYTIGLARPVSLHVETFGTGKIGNDDIVDRIERYFELRPVGMRMAYAPQQHKADNDGCYRDLAVYGHMGRLELDVPWECLDKTEEITQ